MKEERFENPEMPKWLMINLHLSFLTKNIDHIKGYQKLWEDMQDEN